MVFCCSIFRNENLCEEPGNEAMPPANHNPRLKYQLLQPIRAVRVRGAFRHLRVSLGYLLTIDETATS
jgi:hypothetical protein